MTLKVTDRQIYNQMDRQIDIIWGEVGNDQCLTDRQKDGWINFHGSD